MDRRSLLFLVASALLAFGLIGCHHPTEGGVRLEQVVAAFDHEGWKASALPSVDAGRFSAQKCVGGTLDGVDAVICELGGVDAVDRGKKAAEAWVANAVTGAALVNGRTVLALADRARSDPFGKAIHAVTKVYGALK